MKKNMGIDLQNCEKAFMPLILHNKLFNYH